jgi:hypothetical protein
MDDKPLSSAARAYRARLRGGPDDGLDLAVAALPDGAPPEVLHGGDDDLGMYLLAGLPNPDGSMPYWWVPAQSAPSVDAQPGEATWTLISLADDGATKLWHQHGEDSEPVPLMMEPLSSADVPIHIGRAFSCPVCDDTAVLSRPIQVQEADPAQPRDGAPRHVN